MIISMDDDAHSRSGSRFFCCFRCRNLVAAVDDIVNKNFLAPPGRGYLFSHVMNTSEGPKEDRRLISGIHMVADVFCGVCGQKLGWKYYMTYDEDHKYKLGKVVLGKFKIARANDSTFY